MSPSADAAYAEDMMGDESSREYEAQEPATLESLQARFDELDADLSAAGIPTTTEEGAASTPTKAATKDDGPARCERICSLKTAICDVSERICGLAEEHEGEQKYADACTRSEERCEQATGACDSCS